MSRQPDDVRTPPPSPPDPRDNFGMEFRDFPSLEIAMVAVVVFFLFCIIML